MLRQQRKIRSTAKTTTKSHTSRPKLAKSLKITRRKFTTTGNGIDTTFPAPPTLSTTTTTQPLDNTTLATELPSLDSLELEVDIPLNKLLAQSGKVSRRNAANLIKESKVLLNGAPMTNPAHRPEPTDVVQVLESGYGNGFEINIKEMLAQVRAMKSGTFHEGEIIENEALYDPSQPQKGQIVIALNKPPGYICSKSNKGEPTVFDLLPEQFQNLNYAGRLDQHSSGMLLFSNNGTLINTLTHPKSEIEKEYIVNTAEYLSRQHLNRCYEGIWDRTNQQLLRAISITRLKEEIAYTPEPLSNAGVQSKDDDDSDPETPSNAPTDTQQDNYTKETPEDKVDPDNNGDGDGRKWLPNQYSVVLAQGHKREIRRMIAVQPRNQVTKLHRVRIGALLLPEIPVGGYKVLTQNEVKLLLEKFQSRPNPLDYLPRPMKEDALHFSTVSANSKMPPLRDPFQLVLKSVPQRAAKREGLVQNPPGTGISNIVRAASRREAQEQREREREGRFGDRQDRGGLFGQDHRGGEGRGSFGQDRGGQNDRVQMFRDNRPQGFNQRTSDPTRRRGYDATLDTRGDRRRDVFGIDRDEERARMRPTRSEFTGDTRERPSDRRNSFDKRDGTGSGEFRERKFGDRNGGGDRPDFRTREKSSGGGDRGRDRGEKINSNGDLPDFHQRDRDNNNNGGDRPDFRSRADFQRRDNNRDGDRNAFGNRDQRRDGGDNNNRFQRRDGDNNYNSRGGDFRPRRFDGEGRGDNGPRRDFNSERPREQRRDFNNNDRSPRGGEGRDFNNDRPRPPRRNSHSFDGDDNFSFASNSSSNNTNDNRPRDNDSQQEDRTERTPRTNNFDRFVKTEDHFAKSTSSPTKPTSSTSDFPESPFNDVGRFGAGPSRPRSERLQQQNADFGETGLSDKVNTSFDDAGSSYPRPPSKFNNRPNRNRGDNGIGAFDGEEFGWGNGNKH